jgi:gamma-glutamylcyclotransferase (GGCT)/AIG2-like uncharacterized protein YtfP
MRLYFAYGSNMDRVHMTRLCRGAEAVGVAQAENHIFYIAAGGFASLAPRRNSRVHGVLWRISARDLPKLDAYESVQSGLYRPAAIPVHHGGKFLRAMIYYAVEAKPGRPKPGYQEKVVAAAREWDLPADYVGELEKFLPRP